MTSVIDRPPAPDTLVTIRDLNKAFGGVDLYRDFDLDLPRDDDGRLHRGFQRRLVGC